MRQHTIMRTLVLSGLFLACGVFAQTDPPPAFEAASIKPNNSTSGGSHTRTRPAYLQAENVSLRNLITMAYKLRDYQLTGPDWLRTERFDVVAKAKFGTPDDALLPMLQTLLAERFKLTAHPETKEFPVYKLVAMKGKFHLQSVDPAGGSSTNSSSDDKGGIMEAERITMERLADWVSTRMDRPVIDATGLAGAYNMKLNFSRESEKNDADTPKYPIVPLALQEQLGLRLEKGNAPIKMLVVDSVEKVPIEN
jgi:uncharacterized protein (TIGR03435 family)